MHELLNRRMLVGADDVENALRNVNLELFHYQLLLMFEVQYWYGQLLRWEAANEKSVFQAANSSRWCMQSTESLKARYGGLVDMKWPCMSDTIYAGNSL